MRNLWLNLFGLLSLAAVSSAQAAGPIKEGSWEFIIDYSVVGLPVDFPAYTQMQCITRDDPIPRISRSGQECRVKQQNLWSGNLVTWTVNCTTEWETVSGMGELEYSDTSAGGLLHMVTAVPDAPMERVEFTITGHWKGQCE